MIPIVVVSGGGFLLRLTRPTTHPILPPRAYRVSLRSTAISSIGALSYPKLYDIALGQYGTVCLPDGRWPLWSRTGAIRVPAGASKMCQSPFLSFPSFPSLLFSSLLFGRLEFRTAQWLFAKVGRHPAKSSSNGPGSRSGLPVKPATLSSDFHENTPGSPLI